MWRYVDTKSNAADYASRGLKPNEEIKINEWLNGPKFLWETEDKWPSPPAGLKEMPDEHLECRKTARVNRIATSEENIVLDKLLEYYSSRYSLQKGVAWLRGFVLFRCTKFKESTSEAENIKGYLTVKEIQDATEKIAQLVQRKYYHEEIETLRPNESESYELRKNKARSLSKRITLRKLNPILVNGNLRVGGRLGRLLLPFNEKHPIIMPQRHNVTKLIIQLIHQREGHMGSKQVLAAIRKSFWIIHGPSEVRKQIKGCKAR
jgi:hypothetical protein